MSSCLLCGGPLDSWDRCNKCNIYPKDDFLEYVFEVAPEVLEAWITKERA